MRASVIHHSYYYAGDLDSQKEYNEEDEQLS